MKQTIKRMPIIGPLAQRIFRAWAGRKKAFAGSQAYWTARYQAGGNSGAGSYNELAIFKAEVLNDFVKQHGIQTVIEYGCGDGNQLKLAAYPSYIGFDISPAAIALCRSTFAGDPSKAFCLISEYHGETAQLTLSLDVVYHLVEDAIFAEHMRLLFASSERFVAVYSSNIDEAPNASEPHIRRRQFTKWVADNQPGWQLLQHIPNRYPFKGDNTLGSLSDFFIYSKIGSSAR